MLRYASVFFTPPGDIQDFNSGDFMKVLELKRKKKKTNTVQAFLDQLRTKPSKGKELFSQKKTHN